MLHRMSIALTQQGSTTTSTINERLGNIVWCGSYDLRGVLVVTVEQTAQHYQKASARGREGAAIVATVIETRQHPHFDTQSEHDFDVVWKEDVRSELEYAPSERPFAEPPVLDYDKLVVQHNIASDARLKRLFWQGHCHGLAVRDKMTELMLVDVYCDWVTKFAYQLRNGGGKFRTGLMFELQRDRDEISCGNPNETLRKAL